SSPGAPGVLPDSVAPGVLWASAPRGAPLSGSTAPSAGAVAWRGAPMPRGGSAQALSPQVIIDPSTRAPTKPRMRAEDARASLVAPPPLPSRSRAECRRGAVPSRPIALHRQHSGTGAVAPGRVRSVPVERAVGLEGSAVDREREPLAVEQGIEPVVVVGGGEGPVSAQFDVRATDDLAV